VTLPGGQLIVTGLQFVACGWHWHYIGLVDKEF